MTEPDTPEPVKPASVQDVAFVELQVKIADCPAVIEVGFAVSVAVGADDPDPVPEPEPVPVPEPEPDPDPEQEAWLVCVEYGETTTQE